MTNDNKEDWIAKESGLPIGARPELIAEFKDRCNGADLLIVQLSTFLRFAKEELGAAISPSTLEQAKNLQDNAKLNDLAKVTFEADTTRIIPHALHNELRMLQSAAHNPEFNERSQKRAVKEAQRVMELIDRFSVFQHALPTGFDSALSLTSEDRRILSRAIQHYTRESLRHDPASSTENSSLLHHRLTRELNGLERARERLAIDYEESTLLLHATKTEIDSLQMSGEGGRQLVEAEQALRSVEHNLQVVLNQIATTDTRIDSIRKLIDEEIQGEARIIKESFPMVNKAYSRASFKVRPQSKGAPEARSVRTRLSSNRD